MKSNLQMDCGAFTVNQGMMPFAIVSPVAVVNNTAKTRGSVLPIGCTAQWDTGATNNLISPELAKKARLSISTNKAVVNGVNHTSECTVYEGDLILTHGLTAPSQFFIEDKNLEGTGIDVVIGLSIINSCDFALTHSPEGNVVLSVAAPPSAFVNFVSKPIDF